jgi:hypothetical protein
MKPGILTMRLYPQVCKAEMLEVEVFGPSFEGNRPEASKSALLFCLPI